LGTGPYCIGIPKDGVVTYKTAIKSDNFFDLAHRTVDEVRKVREMLRGHARGRRDCARLRPAVWEAQHIGALPMRVLITR
jgi:hypothetical protein